MRREKTKLKDKVETRENQLQRGRKKPGKRKRSKCGRSSSVECKEGDIEGGVAKQ